MISLQEMEFLLENNAEGFSINNERDSCYCHFVGMPYFPEYVGKRRKFFAVTGSKVEYNHRDNVLSTIGTSCRDLIQPSIQNPNIWAP